MTRPFVPWTRQGRFLRVLAIDGCVARAARAAGVDKRTVYRWRRTRPDFSRRWKEAQQKGIDALEALAIRRAVHGPRIVRRRKRKGPSAALLRAQRALLTEMAAKWWTSHRRS